MAIDAALLAEANRTGRAFLRLYRFDPPCLSFGRNEPASGYDRETVARLGIAVVRRPTGGRAVWHEHDVTYAVAAPITAFGGLREAYRTIHAALATALRALGADAALAPDRLSARPPARAGPCFSAPTGGEVLVGGRKVVGSAQVREGAAFLQHGAILLDGSQDVIGAISRQPPAAEAAITLGAALGRRVTWEEVAGAVVRVWRDGVASTVVQHPPQSSPARFLDSAWTWRR